VNVNRDSKTTQLYKHSRMIKLSSIMKKKKVIRIVISTWKKYSFLECSKEKYTLRLHHAIQMNEKSTLILLSRQMPLQM
jgi:hypothetical protein